MENENYSKFKSLLEYFVAHLEYLQNDENADTRGYKKYIEPIKNNSFKKTGAGYKKDKIQNQIKDWESYDKNTICITVVNAHGQKYTTKACYLQWKDTNKNVIAEWDGNSIIKLCIKHGDALVKEGSIEDLGLFDNNSPNNTLKLFLDEYYKLVISDMDKYIQQLKANHNIILHGAPGTGKTYLAKEIAKKMCDIDDIKELEKDGQFKMVQFHPSYDYTDFVEGLRPEDDGKGNIVFKRKDGVFKEFCKKAIDIVAEAELEKAWNKLIQEIKNNGSVQLKQKGKGSDGKPRGNNVEIKLYKDLQDTIGLFQNKSTEKQEPFTLDQCKKIFSGLRLNDIKNLSPSQVGDKGKVSSESDAWAVLYDICVRIEDIRKEAQPSNVKCAASDYFIFLIDEINRGDMSKIFGELFYAIDPGYRGKKGEIPTQYQNLVPDEDDFKGGFYVPDNVYIIGTMNDIDRSVESMDFAMRRRFQFIEVTAESRATGMKLKSEDGTTTTSAYWRMTNLNNCIISKEIGLSKAYQIGGSYFLSNEKDPEGNRVPIKDNFENLWKYKLEGLLREYLRGEEESDVKKKITILERAFYLKDTYKYNQGKDEIEKVNKPASIANEEASETPNK